MTDRVGTDSSSVYDWWSRHPRLLDAFYTLVFAGREASIRRYAVDALDPAPGDRVLELGCGPGNGLAALREQVGAEGCVLAIDTSAGMVQRAQATVRENGWQNVHVCRGDGTLFVAAGRKR